LAEIEGGNLITLDILRNELQLEGGCRYCHNIRVHAERCPLIVRFVEQGNEILEAAKALNKTDLFVPKGVKLN
jgi:hypothetical protein